MVKEDIMKIHILCAQEDNKSIEGGRGWADHFQHFLKLMLEQLLPITFELKTVDEDADFDPEESDFQIALLSPNFILSGSCLDRLEDKFNHISGAEHSKRMYKVVKMPVEAEYEPPKLKALNPYNLFYQNSEKAKAEEIDNFFSKDAERFFWMKMMDMCYDMHEAIIQLSAKKQHKKEADIPARKIIYLAETGQDLMIQRNIIKRELQRNGFVVYPDQQMPDNVIELKEYVTACLEKAQLSIHLIGTSYGSIPVGETRSIVDIQNAIAAEMASHSELHRLVWISPSLKNASEKQLSFIHAIKRDADASAGAEILQTSLEDFKNILREELLEAGVNKKLRKDQASLAMKPSQPSLYYIYDKKDEKEALTLATYLKEQGMNLMMPVHNQKLLETRSHHIDCLKQMDAAIVFQYKVNEQWVHMKLLDLLKAPGFGRNKPIVGKALVISAAEKPRKELIEGYGVEIIGVKENKLIKAFIDKVLKAYKKSIDINA